MATTEGKKAKASGNRFDEDITSVYRLELPATTRHAYDFPVYDILNDEERHMATAFHQQYVAVEGRSAIVQLVNTRIEDISSHTARVMGQAMENIERVESAARLGRLDRRLQDFDNKLIDQTARHLLETNGIGVRTMQEDMRRPLYKPPPAPPSPPPPPKKKGLIPAAFEILFGE